MPWSVIPVDASDSFDTILDVVRAGKYETIRTLASSLEVVRPYCVVITTTPTFAHSIVQVPHKCGTAMAVPAL